MAQKSWPKTLPERGKPTAEVSDSSPHAQRCLPASAGAVGLTGGILPKCNGENHEKLQ